jgi:rare lipoprotein A (peptidoglycan hydrolase)
MQWHHAIGLAWILVAPLGCAASAPSRDVAEPRSAKAARRLHGGRSHTSSRCCPSSSHNKHAKADAGAGTELTDERADCDELEELERRFAGAKPIRVFAGKATYYSDSLAGHAMASGELYQPDCAQAAHRTLPFGTIARVRMVKTGATVVVRIADRGPFAGKNRIIDLSYGAARTIGLLRLGVAEVHVEVLQVPKN